ncbi:LytR/AlgR family response regulator transcription factor [Jiulongibacter sediminis]|jgi:DNA-binding LytR/AlgR family response regulator|uniref:Chemotaxis protein CheY n=1 Tax=Jiulongibacter sediminis TaxID=1605367 RepID=A0A0P7C1U9_9BACT|nr:LytTR family DNA-binding domain-containing protein [Jiulongibacter sediminis]KPM48002.1 chemotaxis protein CheY [Jiulongibacter sediminis]TBX24184.1 chemotaxis protein CheY [Jiulongibacter sediminis]
MNLKCVVVEDEPLARKLMVEYVNSAPGLDLLKDFGNPLEALEFMRENEIDVLFSDIRMKEISGLTLLKLIKSKPFVILTTAYSEYAIEGFELDVTDYLLKPITFERFLKAVEKVNQRVKEREKAPSVLGTPQNAQEDFIFLKDGSKLMKVNLADILYIQGLKDYVKVMTKDKQIVSLQTMKSLEETLPSKQFIRIHNSTIVAFDAIEEIERDKVKIGKNYFSISDSYKKTFKDAIEGKRV